MSVVAAFNGTVTTAQVAYASSPRVYQTFTIATPFPIIDLKIWLNKSGSPTGNASVSIYAIDGIPGVTAVPTGSAIQTTSSTLNVATLTAGSGIANMAIFEFPFAGAVLPAGTYAWELSYTGGDVSNYIRVGIAASNTGDPNQNAGFYTSSYATFPTYDAPFYLYGREYRSHSIDANLRSGATVSATGDWFVGGGWGAAVPGLQYGAVGSFVKDYIYESTHTVDSFLKKRYTKTHTIDTLLRKEVQKTHTIDSLLLKRTTKTHTIDSLLLKRVTKTHTVDALLKKRYTATHTIDAVLANDYTASHTIDTVLKNAGYSKFHSIDTILKSQYTASHTIDTLASRRFQKTHTIDGFLKKRYASTHTIDSFLLKRYTPTHTTDTILRKVISKTHTIDTNIIRRVSTNHTINTVLAKRYTKTNTIDGFLKKRTTVTHSIDTRLKSIDIRTRPRTEVVRETGRPSPVIERPATLNENQLPRHTSVVPDRPRTDVLRNKPRGIQ